MFFKSLVQVKFHLLRILEKECCLLPILCNLIIYQRIQLNIHHEMKILKIIIFILQEDELVGVSNCSVVEMELGTIFKWIVKYSIQTLEISKTICKVYQILISRIYFKYNLQTRFYGFLQDDMLLMLLKHQFSILPLQ